MEEVEELTPLPPLQPAASSMAKPVAAAASGQRPQALAMSTTKLQSFDAPLPHPQPQGPDILLSQTSESDIGRGKRRKYSLINEPISVQGTNGRKQKLSRLA